MKTLKLASFAAVFLFLVASCTKDTLDSSAATLSSREALLGKTDKGTKTDPSTEEDKDKSKVAPLLTLVYNPAIATKGQEVTMTGSFDPAGGVAPTCGTLEIQQKVGEGDDDWETVVLYEDEEGNEVKRVLVTADVQTITYSFIPTEVGESAYTFKVVYKANEANNSDDEEKKCDGYKNSHYEQSLDVKDCVSAFTLDATYESKDLGNGLFEFTVFYTLTSPTDVAGVKLQGGATAGNGTDHQMIRMTGGLVEKEKNKKENNSTDNNTVLTWTGDLKACEKKEFSFTYQRQFKCPATAEEITGHWTAKQGEVLLGEKLPLKHSCQ